MKHTVEIGPLAQSQGLSGRVLGAGGVLSGREVVDAWMSDGEFALAFARALADVPFEACFWETPAWTHERLSEPFEFVLIESRALARVTPDKNAFDAHFGPSGSVVAFNNLRADARLVVPSPISGGAPYPHLLSFVRQAPPQQQRRLWPEVAQALVERMDQNAPKPVWLSTAGMGVSWLHVRVDDRPKYYRHAPYRAAPDGS